uniref:Uncharacterized protein n=1 Tax=Arundo donax TaxID=35708 RepID=A0A0A8ZP45_ARUDO
MQCILWSTNISQSFWTKKITTLSTPPYNHVIHSFQPKSTFH